MKLKAYLIPEQNMKKSRLWSKQAPNSFSVEYFDFSERNSHEVPLKTRPPVATKLLGHGGTDFYLVDSFAKAVANNDATMVLTGMDSMILMMLQGQIIIKLTLWFSIDAGVEESLKSHLLTFAAEKARKENRVVTIETDPEYFM